jgi:hypothetical protein
VLFPGDETSHLGCAHCHHLLSATSGPIDSGVGLSEDDFEQEGATNSETVRSWVHEPPKPPEQSISEQPPRLPICFCDCARQHARIVYEEVVVVVGGFCGLKFDKYSDR